MNAPSWASQILLAFAGVLHLDHLPKKLVIHEPTQVDGKSSGTQNGSGCKPYSVMSIPASFAASLKQWRASCDVA